MSHLAKLQRALQAHVLTGESNIAEAIDSSVAIPAATRLQIYSDAYRLRLIDALQANYPLLAQFIGDHAFSRLTQLYLALHPSRHYSIRWFGHRLAEFLEEYPDYRSQPWLTELATWEWMIATAFDAQDAATVTAMQLAAVAPDAWPELRFSFHPSVQRVTLTTNVVALAQAAAEGVSLPRPSIQPRSEWLIWRQELTVQYRLLDLAEATAVDSAMSGASFGAMCEALAVHLEADQVPLQAATFLKRWITDDCLTQ